MRRFHSSPLQMPLNPEDQRHLTAAEGYAQLGMFLDANEELEKIDADVRHLPEVLAVRVEIYSGLKKWELLRVVAKKLADHDPDEPQWPISLAYATRRAESIEAAKLILLEAVERHPKEPMIHYNLACYECVMGEVEVAKARLRHAFELEPRCRLMALEDEDLRAVWREI
jgi:tetratricopeptide (TPR) repeat protein